MLCFRLFASFRFRFLSFDGVARVLKNIYKFSPKFRVVLVFRGLKCQSIFYPQKWQHKPKSFPAFNQYEV